MIDIYVLYLDVYLLQSILLNQILLLFTLILMGRRVQFGRLLLASLLGGILSLLPLFMHMTFGVLYVLFIAITGLVMIYVLTGREILSRQITGLLYYYMLSFVLNRIFDGIARIIGMGYTAGVMAVVTMGSTVAYLCYRKTKDRMQTIYKVQIARQGQKISLNGLYDTGNALREPISGKPVSIIEEDIYQNFYRQEIPDKYRAIPYHSIGKAHGILKGMEVDELIIWKDDKPYILKQAIVALYEGRLSQDGSYQMILHSSLL